MDAGVAYFPTHDAVGPGEIARLVEERGHRWLMYAEHTHIPSSRDTPWGGREDAPPLPRKYAHTYDLFIACATSLAATRSLRVGTGICLVTERDPIITAKEVASLDHLSGGRFDFGIGDEAYKDEYCDVVLPLHVAVLPRTLRGRLFLAGGRGLDRLRASGPWQRVRPYKWVVLRALRRAP